MKTTLLTCCALLTLSRVSRADELFNGVSPVAIGFIDLASDKFLFYDSSAVAGSRVANITPLVLKTDFQLPTPTDLSGGTTLAVQKDYFDTVAADRTFAALPAGANGDKIYLTFDVTGATRSLNFHTNSTVYRVGESGAVAAAIEFPVGNHTLKLTKEDAKWWLTDSGTVPGTYATLTGIETLTNKSLTSATLTGTSVAPTAATGTSTTQLATTAFVQAEVDTTQTGVHATPSTTTPLAPTWSGPTQLIWYGATGEIDLPAAAGYAGRGLILYNTGAFTVTFDPNLSEVIVRDGTVQTGGVSFTLSSGAGNYVALVSDGARWVTLGYKGTLTVGS